MKEGDKVQISGETYEYCDFYKRLERKPEDGMFEHDGTYELPAIACPECKGFEFRITYGDCECIANCKCGHSMTIYDG